MKFQFYDIINKCRPEHIDDAFSAKHPKMRRQDRAKIFAPFAALSGHAEQTHAQERITVPKIELSEDSINRIDFIIQDMEEMLVINKTVNAAITYFVPDKSRKYEGSYTTVDGVIDKIDVTFGRISIAGQIIKFDDIYDIEMKK